MRSGGGEGVFPTEPVDESWWEVTGQAGGVSREPFLRPDVWERGWLWCGCGVGWRGEAGQEVQTGITWLTMTKAKATGEKGMGQGPLFETW